MKVGKKKENAKIGTISRDANFSSHKNNAQWNLSAWKAEKTERNKDVLMRGSNKT